MKSQDVPAAIHVCALEQAQQDEGGLAVTAKAVG
jgi:hypothetical protein